MKQINVAYSCFKTVLTHYTNPDLPLSSERMGYYYRDFNYTNSNEAYIKSTELYRKAKKHVVKQIFRLSLL